MFIRSKFPETKGQDGAYVNERTDYCVVETEDGKLSMIHRGELDHGPLEKLVIQSSREHMKVHNGKEVRPIRNIKPGDNGFSDLNPQVVVAPKEGALLTVQNSELVDVEDLKEFDGTVHSKRAELKDHKGESVRVLRSVRPGDDAYEVNGPYQYWVRGKDNKEYAVHAGELKPSKVAVKPEDEDLDKRPNYLDANPPYVKPVLAQTVGPDGSPVPVRPYQPTDSVAKVPVPGQGS